MKRKTKILATLFTVLLFSMVLFSAVEAKSGQEKKNSKFLDYVLHVEFAKASDDYPSEWRWNPPSVMDEMVPPYSQYLALPPEGARVCFVENRIWYLPPVPPEIAERYVTIGDVNIDLQPEDFYCLYDVTWIYQAEFGIYQLDTTITIDSPEYSGIIEIKSIERTIIDGGSMIGEGTFVGHGVINGQNVKVSGVRNVLIVLPVPGVPMPPPTMEETGTIQFLS